MSRRTERVSELLRETLGALIVNAKDPRLGALITVQRVEMTPDLQHAIVSVTLLGDSYRRKEALAGLTAATPFMRREVGRLLKLKRTPELRFILDQSIEEGDRVLSLLDALRQETARDG